MKKLLVFLSLLSPVLFAQAPPSPSQYNFFTPAPPSPTPATQVNGQASNGFTYWYFVVTRYVGGNVVSPNPGGVAYRVNPVLGGGNSVTVSWTPQPGATGYDVIRQTTANFTGVCTNCLVASNTLSTTVSDNTNTLPDYTMTAPFPGASGSISLSPYGQFILNPNNTNLPTGSIAATVNPLKGNGTGGAVAAVASDIVSLFSTCSGIQYLGADGSCHTASGGGISIGTTQVNGGTAGFCLTVVAAIPQPVLGNASCPSGSGTVTSFSAGNLSPLFSTSVATATTTPALTFTLTSAAQNLFFASPNGSSGAGAYRAIVAADLPTLSTTVNGQTCTIGSTCTIPVGGTIASTTSVLKGNGSGGAVAVAGAGTNCVQVNGSSTSCGGGGSSFPFVFVQDAMDWGPPNNVNSYTITFEQPTAASGNTIYMLLGMDGSAPVGLPAGWTVDINIAEPTYSRLVLIHKATAGDVSATFTEATSTMSAYYFEVQGTHGFDTYTQLLQANSQAVNFPSFTPTAGAAVYAACGITLASAIQLVNPVSPYWHTLNIFTQAGGGARSVIGLAYSQAASGSAMLPPQLNTSFALYAGGGMACASFSLL